MKVSQKVPKSKHPKQHKNEPLSAPEITATISFYAFFFQLADGNQTVNRVSGEAADRLCDDEVDFTGHGIGDHFIKADAMFGVRAGNALVGVNLNKLPFGIAFDVLRVVIHLCLVAGL